MLVLQIVLMALGIGLLVKGSDMTVDSAKAIAKSVGVSDLFIGLTVTSIGTSIPEIATTAAASLKAAKAASLAAEMGTSLTAAKAAASGIAIGNIIGSNMTQITLMLGVAALLRSIDTTRKALLRDGVMMIIASLLAFGAICNLEVTNVEGTVLVVLYLLYLYYLLKTEKAELERVGIERPHYTGAVLVAGIAGVVLGAKLLVDSAIEIAEYLGVPSSIIGLTIVAVGTSLPELAISVAAVMKGLHGLSIGNLIGSNITDPMFSMGIAAAINPYGLAVDPAIVAFDAPVMILSCMFALYMMRTNWNLSRKEGAVLVGIYILFLYVNFAIKI